MKSSKINFAKGFTLIELLVVIAVLGILAAGVLVGIDPVDRINAASDSRVQNDVGTIGRASEAYAAARGGFYPSTIDDEKTNGDLKVIPAPPTGYTVYAVQHLLVTPCVGGTTCTDFIVTGQLKSKKYVNAVPATPVWRYESVSGKSCPRADAITPCS